MVLSAIGAVAVVWIGHGQRQAVAAE